MAAQGGGRRNTNAKVTNENPKLLGVHGEEYIIDKVLRVYMGVDQLLRVLIYVYVHWR